MKTKSNRVSEEKFSNQVRFNWGYHDAAQSVKSGWDNAEYFWGFARELGQQIVIAEDILSVHFDKSYANGWLIGYRAAKDGTYKSSSLEAWTAFNNR